MAWGEIDRPRDSDIHTIADFFEILCITSLDSEVSLDDMEDHLSDYSCDYLKKEEDRFDVKGHIEWRMEAFLNRYPFEMDSNTIRLSTNLNLTQKAYLFLLLSANLPFIEKIYRNDFTETFEDLSLLSLTQFTGNKAESKRFGKNNKDFSGTKAERLNDLFNKIGNKGLCDDSYFRQRDSGDGGIDLVSWYKADNYEIGNIMSILAQCACSRSEWSKKQNDASYDRIGHLGQNSNRWNSMLFTPICFRDNAGRWFVKGDIQNNIVFDRLRVINFLKENDLKTFNFPSNFDLMLTYSRTVTE